MSPSTPSSQLRRRLEQPDKIVVASGVFDGISARLGVSLDFDALYMTGAGTSMSRIGWADLGLTTMNEMTDNAAMITALAPSTSLITDIDSGHGGPLMVDRTLKRLTHARVASFHLEDHRSAPAPAPGRIYWTDDSLSSRAG